jgi:hypothetical protein
MSLYASRAGCFRKLAGYSDGDEKFAEFAQRTLVSPDCINGSVFSSYSM